MSWPVVPLHEICRPKQWKTVSSSKLLDDGYPVYGANGVIGYYDSYTHELPTLMITCRGATCGNVHISKPKSYINGNAMALDKLNTEKVFINYLYYFFKSRGFNDVISGSAQPQITGQGLTKVLVPLPPLDEQKRIAAILDKADAIRQKRKQAIALADEFLRSVFLEMFGDPVTNPKGWALGSMADFGGFKNGLNYSRDENGVELSYIGVGDFKSHSKLERIENLSKIQLNENPDDGYLLKDNDILFVRSNGNKALVGRCLTVHPGEHKVTFSGFCIRYRVQKIEELNPTFLNYCMRMPSMKNAMLKGGQGANIQNINQKTLTELSLPIPPIEVQKDFESLVSRYQLFIERALDGANNDNALFSALSQKAFSSQL